MKAYWHLQPTLKTSFEFIIPIGEEDSDGYIKSIYFIVQVNNPTSPITDYKIDKWNVKFLKTGCKEVDSTFPHRHLVVRYIFENKAVI
jgi:hypothetical protein